MACPHFYNSLKINWTTSSEQENLQQTADKAVSEIMCNCYLCFAFYQSFFVMIYMRFFMWFRIHSVEDFRQALGEDLLD